MGFHVPIMVATGDSEYLSVFRVAGLRAYSRLYAVVARFQVLFDAD